MSSLRFASVARTSTAFAAAITAALCIAGPAQAASKTLPAGLGQVGAGVKFSAVHGVPSGQSLLASNLVINMAGITSFDALDEPVNTVLALNALVGATVDTISWNLSLTTVGDSWLSEAAVLITNGNGDGIYFNPGAGDDLSGSATYADGGSLVALGLSFDVLADGKLYVQFYEDYDDNPGTADALYTAGNITLGGIGVATSVPEPASYGLMAMGLLAVAAAARRRRAN